MSLANGVVAKSVDSRRSESPPRFMLVSFYKISVGSERGLFGKRTYPKSRAHRRLGPMNPPTSRSE
jgi:hypothetical protein